MKVTNPNPLDFPVIRLYKTSAVSITPNVSKYLCVQREVHGTQRERYREREVHRERQREIHRESDREIHRKVHRGNGRYEGKK